MDINLIDFLKSLIVGKLLKNAHFLFPNFIYLFFCSHKKS